MKTFIILLVLCVLCCACASVSLQTRAADRWVLRADALRAQAHSQFVAGDKLAAINSIKKALQLSPHLALSSISLVELYDDAGLYFYTNKQWREAAHHQAIAVLLACNQPEAAALFSVYVRRLGFVFAEYNTRQEFNFIEVNPFQLLMDKDLNLSKNADIRRRFYKVFSVNNAKQQVPTLIYKINPAALLGTCTAPVPH
jgi:hypothetical protein